MTDDKAAEALARAMIPEGFQPDAADDESFIRSYRKYCREEAIERANRALAAIRAGQVPGVEAGGWRPISEAKKDGTTVIVCVPDGGVMAARHTTMEEFVPKDANGDPLEHYDDEFSCWWHDPSGWLEREMSPTHFRPLPAPPEAGA